MRTANLTGQDLAYWVARANLKGSSQELNVLRRHYGEGLSNHEPASEPSMRDFVASRCGAVLSARETWQ